MLIHKELNKKIIFISLVPLKIGVIGMVCGPWLGIYVSYILGQSYKGVFVDIEFLYNYSFYVALFIVATYLTTSKLSIILPILSKNIVNKYQNRVFFIAIFCLFIIFFAAGKYILSGQMDRGEIRASFGLWGPAYNYVVKYILPALVFCNLILSNLQTKYKKRTILIYIIVCVSAFLTGYKLTVVIVFLPLLCSLWSTISVIMKLIVCLLVLAIPVVSHFLFGNSQDFLDSFNYVIARATSIAAYGVIGCWDYSKTVDLDLMPIIIRGVLGNGIGSFILEGMGYLKGQRIFSDITMLITYEYYNAQDRALEGSVNLTLTLFGELIILSRQFWVAWIIPFFLLIHLLLRLLIKQFYVGNLGIGIVVFTYFNIVILPIINSSGIFSSISLPTIIYLFLTYLLLIYLLPKELNKGWKLTKKLTNESPNSQDSLKSTLP